MKSEAFLNEIRQAAGLRRAVLRKIAVEGREVVFHLATDLRYSEEDEAHARAVCAKYVPEGFAARAKLIKSVPDAESVRKKIADILSCKFPAAAAFVSPQDIEVEKDEGGGRFFLAVGQAERGQFSSGAILDALSTELQRSFSGTWFGNVRAVEKAQEEIEREAPPPAEVVIAPRFFPVTEYAAIDGGKPKRAIYIADLTDEATDITVCGQITYLQERETAKGKPYLSITLSDGTAQTRISYFTKKATLEKARSLKVGDWICLTGDNEIYNNSLSFRAKALDFGKPPADFVPEARPSRPAPFEYKKVIPLPVSDYRQAMLFGKTPLPQDFTQKEFVVFDLETTGLNNTPATGAMDRIIEIGAVKIREGKICEKFSSFVACALRLSPEIVHLTGITDSMLVGAPDIADVIADFYKFSHDCILVGHNIMFDYKFIRHYGEREGYLFDQKMYDTLSISQEVLRLSNYKLNTLADHYGFSFNHHRAYDDAFVTAKIFIELIKERKSLPK